MKKLNGILSLSLSIILMLLTLACLFSGCTSISEPTAESVFDIEPLPESMKTKMRKAWEKYIHNVWNDELGDVKASMYYGMYNGYVAFFTYVPERDVQYSVADGIKLGDYFFDCKWIWQLVLYKDGEFTPFKFLEDDENLFDNTGLSSEQVGKIAKYHDEYYHSVEFIKAVEGDRNYSEFLLHIGARNEKIKNDPNYKEYIISESDTE